MPYACGMGIGECDGGMVDKEGIEGGLVMGREVRRVPANWEHPKDEEGHYIPLHEGPYSKREAEWDEGKKQWDKGFRLSYEVGGPECYKWVPKEPDKKNRTYTDWDGPRPKKEHYMPEWTETERTHLQMYESCTEGTPISPVMETPEKLARWLADNGASSFGSMTASYEDWLATIKAGWCPSAIVNMGTGEMKSGVSLSALPKGDVLSQDEIDALNEATGGPPTKEESDAFLKKLREKGII